jgi:hypothetical protein
METSGSLDIELKFTADELGTTSWKFAFRADSKKIRADVQKQAMDVNFTLPDDTAITLDTFVISPLWYKIDFTASRNSNYNLKFTGEDNLGNAVEFYMDNFDGETHGEMRLETLDGSIDKQASSITLTPYAAKFPEESGEAKYDWVQTGEKFTIEL